MITIKSWGIYILLTHSCLTASVSVYSEPATDFAGSQKNFATTYFLNVILTRVENVKFNRKSIIPTRLYSNKCNKSDGYNMRKTRVTTACPGVEAFIHLYVYSALNTGLLQKTYSFSKPDLFKSVILTNTIDK